jgi:two-component system chemotaxis sensor kinase CheA
MALDLSRFAKAFFEEAQEHISALETLLVAVNLRAPDAEALNAIFRAVHSVKGGAAAFGHKALSEFTHDFETILDRVRKGKLTLTKPMVNIFLRAGDVMRHHLLALEKEVEPDAAAMQALRLSLADLTAAELEPPPLLEEVEPAPPPRFRIEIHLEKAQYASDEALAELKGDIAGLSDVVDMSTHSIDERLLAFVFNLNTDIDADDCASLEFIVPARRSPSPPMNGARVPHARLPPARMPGCLPTTPTAVLVFLTARHRPHPNHRAPRPRTQRRRRRPTYSCRRWSMPARFGSTWPRLTS